MNLLKNKKFSEKNNRLKLKNLPSLFFFTDRKRFKNIFSVIAKLPKGTAIVVREYDLDYQQRLIFALKVKSLALENSLKIIIGKNLSLALEIKADGVHFSDLDISWMNYLRHKNSARKNFIFTCSCHQVSSLIKAEKSGFDAVFYSPIFPTKSHLGQSSIGVLKLAKIALKIQIPIFALGGINHENISLLRGCKITGIAGIGLFESKSN